MNKKYEALIRQLVSSYEPTSASTLATALAVTTRTVKAWVRDLNDLYHCVTATKTGYLIDKTIARQILAELETASPQTSKERIAFIIKELVREPVDAYQLCDQLFVSMPTLRNDLVKVKRKVSPFDLTLNSKSDLLSIDGPENNKRRLLSSILYSESTQSFVNLDAIQEWFEEIDIFRIKDVLAGAFRNHHYFINDYSLINVVLHITIAIDRMKNGITTPGDSAPLPLSADVLALTDEMAARLEEVFQVVLSAYERNELAILIASRATSIDYKNISSKNLLDFIEPEVLALVQKVIASINAWYFINLSEPELLTRFALHIKNLLKRSQNARFVKNPLVNDIKSGCPLIYDAAVHISAILKEETGIQITDDEIAYIAFHIGSILEAQKEFNNKLSALLFCPNYYDLDTKLVERVNERFARQLLIADVINDIERSDISGTDLIISTVPIGHGAIEGYVQVSPFLSQNDIDRIDETVKQLRKEKQKREFRDIITKLITQELFEYCREPLVKDRVIRYMCAKLNQLGCVGTHFVDQVFERETMSSTAYTGFAIPHAMKMNANKTGIFVLIANPPILWNEQAVQLVLMMFFNETERYLFNKVYEPITMVLNNAENLNKLVKCQRYDCFIDTMVEQIQI